MNKMCVVESYLSATIGIANAVAITYILLVISDHDCERRMALLEFCIEYSNIAFKNIHADERTAPLLRTHCEMSLNNQPFTATYVDGAVTTLQPWLNHYCILTQLTG